MEINLIIAFISFVFGLVGVVIGILIVGKLEGRFKHSVIFLIFAVAIFVIEEIIEILDFIVISNLRIVKNIALMIIIVFILLAMLNMKQMINGIECKYRK